MVYKFNTTDFSFNVFIFQPQVALYLPAVTFDELPMIIFGSTTFVAAILSLLLPETLGAPLIESLDELFLLHKYSKPLLSWWSLEQVNNNVEQINALRNSPGALDTGGY